MGIKACLSGIISQCLCECGRCGSGSDEGGGGGQ